MKSLKISKRSYLFVMEIETDTVKKDTIKGH